MITSNCYCSPALLIYYSFSCLYCQSPNLSVSKLNNHYVLFFLDSKMSCCPPGSWPQLKTDYEAVGKETQLEGKFLL